MARQLIYTSAEHGLAAGRSGFCTVAQHADLRERLIAELERLSAFDRPPAGQPLPVIRSHRILTVGSDRYHILSCIQDAGPDYSGRTNHIAHHLICEENELTAAASPTLVLLRFPWRQRWTESSRYLGDADQIDLSRFREPMPTGGGWKELTGNPAHALLLLESKARQGCYVAYAVKKEDLLLEVFDESLGKITFKSLEKKWQISFTTLLQATDNPRDFSWRGCWVGSSTHRSAVASGETVFDLTQPSSLPSPAPVEVARAVTVTAVPTRSKVQVVTATKPPQKKSMWRKVRSRYEGLSAEEMQQQLAGQIPPEVLAAREKGLKRRRLALILLPLFALPILAFIAIGIKKVLEKSPAPSTASALIQLPTTNSSLSATRQNLQVASPDIKVPPSTTTPSSSGRAVADGVQNPNAAPTSLVTHPSSDVKNELDQLPEMPTYFALGDLKESGVEVAGIFSKHEFYQKCTIRTNFNGFSENKTGDQALWSVVEGQNAKLRLAASDTRIWAILTPDKSILKEADVNYSSVVIVFTGKSSFQLILFDQATLTNYLSHIQPLCLSTNWLDSDSNSQKVSLKRELKNKLDYFVALQTNITLLRLTAENLPYQQESLAINLAALKEDAESKKANAQRSLEQYQQKYSEVKTRQLNKLQSGLQQEPFNSSGDELLRTVDFMVDKDSEKLVSFAKFLQQVSVKDDSVWNAYVDYNKEIFKKVLPIIKLEGQVESFVSFLEMAKNKPRMLFNCSDVLNNDFRKIDTKIWKNNKEKDEIQGFLNSFCKKWKSIYSPDHFQIIEAQLVDDSIGYKPSILNSQDMLTRANDSLKNLPDKIVLTQLQVKIQIGSNWWSLIKFTDGKNDAR